MEKKFQQINEQAAARASDALSKLIGRPVGVNVRKTEVRKIEELEPLVGIEDVVAGIYLPVTGDIKGGALLVFPQDATFALSDLLVKRPAGTTRKMTELDESAIKEVGNIISGNYLTVLSNTLQIKIIQHLPSFSFDMFGAIASQIITEFAQKTGNALVVEIEFTFNPETLKAYFLLLFDVEQFSVILSALEADSAVH
jgi:chemotaxis protein CheC